MSIFKKKSSKQRKTPEGVESSELHDDEMVQGEDNHEEKSMTDRYSDSNNKKESTRSHIAQLYVWAFFAVIVAVFVIGCCKSFTVDEYKDMLVTVSGVLSGPLGFIVGYYFKASKE